jgi:hypothetical protein
MQLIPVACILFGIGLCTGLPYINMKEPSDNLSERYDEGTSDVQNKDENDNNSIDQGYNEEDTTTRAHSEDDSELNGSENSSVNERRGDESTGLADSDSDVYIDESKMNWTTEDNWSTANDNENAGPNNDNADTYEKKSHSHYVNEQNNAETV